MSCNLFDVFERKLRMPNGNVNDNTKPIKECCIGMAISFKNIMLILEHSKAITSNLYVSYIPHHHYTDIFPLPLLIAQGQTQVKEGETRKRV